MPKYLQAYSTTKRGSKTECFFALQMDHSCKSMGLAAITYQVLMLFSKVEANFDGISHKLSFLKHRHCITSCSPLEIIYSYHTEG